MFKWKKINICSASNCITTNLNIFHLEQLLKQRNAQSKIGMTIFHFSFGFFFYYLINKNLFCIEASLSLLIGAFLLKWFLIYFASLFFYFLQNKIPEARGIASILIQGCLQADFWVSFYSFKITIRTYLILAKVLMVWKKFKKWSMNLTLQSAIYQHRYFERKKINFLTN